VPASTSAISNTTVAIAQLVATGRSFDDAKNRVLGEESAPMENH
jgi:hypothetical protein